MMETDLELACAFMELHPENAAMSLEKMPADEVTALLSEVPVETAALVIVRMAPYFAVQCLKALPEKSAGDLLGTMPRDHSALLLRRMRAEDRSRLLDAAAPRVSAGLTLLLRFPENTAGALMDPEVLSLPKDVGVADALERVRHSGARIFYYLYVTDRERKLAGVVNLRELIEAPEDKQLEDIMHTRVDRLSVHADPIAMRAHPGLLEYYALPVVDDHGVLVGVLRFRTLRSADLENIKNATIPGPMSGGFALSELYWSTLGQLLQTLWPPLNTASGAKSEERDGR